MKVMGLDSKHFAAFDAAKNKINLLVMTCKSYA